MEQRITFVASIVVDSDEHNWSSAMDHLSDLIEVSTLDLYDLKLLRVIKLEIVEDDAL